MALIGFAAAHALVFLPVALSVFGGVGAYPFFLYFPVPQFIYLYIYFDCFSNHTMLTFRV